MNMEQCEGCLFWRPLSSTSATEKACHHLLDTGKRHVEENGVCKSKKTGEGDKASNRVAVISIDQDGNESWYPSITHAAQYTGLWHNQITRAIASGRPYKGRLWRKADESCNGRECGFQKQEERS